MIGFVAIVADADVTIIEVRRERVAVYQQTVGCQQVYYCLQMLLPLIII